jgi:hypothetical protein
MNNSNVSDLCYTAMYLGENTLIRALLILRTGVGITGVIFMLLLFKIQGTNLALHENGKILLTSHHIWALLLSVGNILAPAFDLIRYSVLNSDSDPCDYLVKTTTAVAMRGLDLLCTYGEVFALAAMAVERCVATIQYRTYEIHESMLGKVLLVAQVSNYYLF